MYSGSSDKSKYVDEGESSGDDEHNIFVWAVAQWLENQTLKRDNLGSNPLSVTSRCSSSLTPGYRQWWICEQTVITQ